jgi:hypothetical protein
VTVETTTTNKTEKLMAAHIENRDSQTGLEMAWHGLTKVVPQVTLDNAFTFEIERTPFAECPEWSFFKCSDDNKMAGVPVAETYSTMTNSRFWETIQNSTGGCGAVVESAGTLFNRSRRFATVKLSTDNNEFKVGNRTFKNRLSFLDSIDGSTNFYGINSSVCVVCANTFNMALRDKSAEFKFKVRHSKNFMPKIENMEKAIESFIGTTAHFKAAMENAEAYAINEAAARQLFTGWIGSSSTRSENTAERLTHLFNFGAGNSGRTLLDVFSAVTDFYSHESSGGSEFAGFRQKQALSSEFGSGARKKTELFQGIFQPNGEVDASGIRSLIAAGKLLLAN